MKMRLLSVPLLLVLVAAGLFLAHRLTAAGKPEPRPETHTEWITRSLKEMQTVKPGMTRAQLLKVFTTEGGLSTTQARTYVYRECPYIKVDVTFKIEGRPERDAEGRLTSEESLQDTIVTITKPYLNWSIMD